MASSANPTVPTGFPANLHGPLAWDGETYQNHAEKYVILLSEEEIESVDKALRHFQSLKLAPGHLTAETFPLPTTLSTKLTEISNELYNGRGFSVVRGLDPRKYTPEENVIVFAGVASHVAPERSTDQNGLTLSHIRNAQTDRPVGQDLDLGKLRPSKRSEAMDFHTDTAAGDILAMYVKGLHDHTGGKQYLSSFWQTYNLLSAEAPHVLHTLASAFPWEDADPVTREPRVDYRPLIFSIDGTVQIQYVTVPLLGSRDHARPEDLPALTTAQKEALEALQSSAKKMSFELDRELGDIQFVNNLSILHGRSAFAVEVSGTQIAAYTVNSTQTVITTTTTDVVANVAGDSRPYTNRTSTTTPTDTNVLTNVDPTNTVTTTTTTTKGTSGNQVILNDGENTTTTTTTQYTIGTIMETTTVTNPNGSSSKVDGANNTSLTATTQVNNVDGDPNTTRTIVTTSSNRSILCAYISGELAQGSAAPATRLLGYSAPRHFLRVFLRDSRHSWRKPELYHKRFEQCFSVPAEEQFLPALDYDPTNATVNTGGEPHG
ncbi:hypothetical protein EG329_002100 [Mollisiaceae sp. DMI_Dod_QoI]|nr:hypothetical protein EG329_002100 [Helotiales sp. DMI_Dod_QoI]